MNAPTLILGGLLATGLIVMRAAVDDTSRRSAGLLSGPTLLAVVLWCLAAALCAVVLGAGSW